jgi:hypothetical protein
MESLKEEQDFPSSLRSNSTITLQQDLQDLIEFQSTEYDLLLRESEKSASLIKILQVELSMTHKRFGD